jgi:malate/lactate dehydrogenase
LILCRRRAIEERRFAPPRIDSIGTESPNGSYGVEEGLISSFPIRSRVAKWEIVQKVPINDFSRAKIDASVNELREEKSLFLDLLG